MRSTIVNQWLLRLKSWEPAHPALCFQPIIRVRIFDDIVELIAPQGRFGLIDDPDGLDIMPFKKKAVSTHWGADVYQVALPNPQILPSKASCSTKSLP